MDSTKYELNKSKQDKVSEAKRIKNIFLKYQKWFKEEYETKDFKEPIVFLERNNGNVEFYESATSGRFDYIHSDGTARFIMLTPSKIKKFGFGAKMFRGYYCHEDAPFPLPKIKRDENEQVNMLMQKSTEANKKWKANEIKARGQMFKNIGIAIALIIGALALYMILKPNTVPSSPEIAIIKDTTVQAIRNATIIS